MRYFSILLLMLVLMVCSSLAWAQTTYTWTGAVDTAWDISGNWTPSRITPANTDILIFNGVQTNQPTFRPSALKQTVGRIQVTGNTTLRMLIGNGTTSLTTKGGTPEGLKIESGASLTVIGIGSPGVAQLIVNNNGGVVAGTLTIQGVCSVPSTDAVNKLVFQNGSVFNASQSTGNPFGAGTANTVRFASGSTFNQNTPVSDPFALTAPASVVIFDPGSNYNFNVASGGNPFVVASSGRIYPNVTFTSAWTYSLSGASDCTINGTLTIGASSVVKSTATGRLRVSGDVVNNDTLTLSSGRIELNGTTGQAISGSGYTSFDKGMIVNDVGNVTLQESLSIGDTLFLTAGKLYLGNNTLTLHNPVSGAGASTFIVTNGTGSVVDSIAGGSSMLFPVSPNGTAYNPVTVTLAGGDPAERFAVRVVDGVTPSMTDNSTAVQRTWDISEGTAGGNNATLAFQWTPADEGAAFLRNYASAWHHDGAAWNLASTGSVAGSDPYVFTASTPVSAFSPFVIANGLPKAQIAPLSLAFGNVNTALEKTDSVFVKNTGSALLDVTNATIDNSAFTVTPATASIQPSDSAVFHVTFHPTGAGPFAATLQFTTNGTTGSDATVSLSGTGTQPSFSVAPAALAFGDVWLDSTKTDTLTVSNTSTTEGLRIDSVRSTNANFTVEPASAVVDTMATQKFTVTFHPLAAGSETGAVIFYHNASPTPDTVLVSGTGVEKKPLFTVTPSTLSLGNVNVGYERTDSVYVKNAGNAPLLISSASSDNAAFSVTPTAAAIAPSDSAYFRVTFHPSTLGPVATVLRFVANGIAGSDTTINLEGNGVQPGFFVQPIALGFGNVWIDSTKTDTLTVTNTSTTAGLVIDSVRSTNGHFAVTPSAVSIDTMGTQKFMVTFHPVSAGPDTGMVIFYHNAATKSDTVIVYGNGAVMQAHFALSHSSLAFGNLMIGHAKTDSVTLANGGELPLIVSSTVNKNTGFHVALSRDTVQAGDSAVVRVTFEPAFAGAYADTVVFASNAPEGTDTLFVTGTATGVMTIAEARSLSNGSDVLIEAVVTRAKGAYTRLQDSTAAIVIYGTTGAFHDSVASGAVAMGDLIRIEGKTSESSSLKEIGTATISSFSIVSRGNPLPAPKLVTLAELDSAGEKYESQLVRLVHLRMNGATGTFAAATTYSIVDATDSTGNFALQIPNAADTDADTVQIPLGTFTYTGVVGQFSSGDPAIGYRLNPVLATDIAADPVNSVAALPTGIPVHFVLEQNFPNPFNPSTTIQYALPMASNVKITIYSILGQEVATLVDGLQTASYYRVTWDGKSSTGTQVASGIYLYRIEARPADNTAAPFVKVNKMLLLK